MAQFIIEHPYTALYLYKVEADTEEEAIAKYEQALETQDDIKSNGCAEFISGTAQIFDPDFWVGEYEIEIGENSIEQLPS